MELHTRRSVWRWIGRLWWEGNRGNHHCSQIKRKAVRSWSSDGVGGGRSVVSSESAANGFTHKPTGAAALTDANRSTSHRRLSEMLPHSRGESRLAKNRAGAFPRKPPTIRWLVKRATPALSRTISVLSEGLSLPQR